MKFDKTDILLGILALILVVTMVIYCWFLINIVKQTRQMSADIVNIVKITKSLEPYQKERRKQKSPEWQSGRANGYGSLLVDILSNSEADLKADPYRPEMANRQATLDSREKLAHHTRSAMSSVKWHSLIAAELMRSSQ